jgi:hypothetical protein
MINMVQKYSDDTKMVQKYIDDTKMVQIGSGFKPAGSVSNE